MKNFHEMLAKFASELDDSLAGKPSADTIFQEDTRTDEEVTASLINQGVDLEALEQQRLEIRARFEQYRA